MENSEKEKITPKVTELQVGTHYICKCGASKNFPLCDGSHKTFETDETPTIINLDEPKVIAFCRCKQSKNGIYCDGSHKQ